MGRYIAKYLRISDDDDIGEHKLESDSIGNQRKVLENYIENHEELSGCPTEEFLDDGFSGVHFNRPGIQKLLKEVRESKVSCIIVKDLSRFGRNYIEVGDFIEQIFPFMGVRFISVSDNYDSLFHSAGIDIGFKNLIHDLYSRDLSKKIKSVKHLYQERGRYNGGDVPYGYQRQKGSGVSYCPDPDAAKIVKKIFQFAAEGTAPAQIADILNSESVPTPGAYKNQTTSQNYMLRNKKRNLWTSTQVREIIQNEVYTGSYICRKITSVKPRKLKRNDKSVYLKFEGDHEALAEKEQFIAAQRVISQKCRRTHYNKEDNPHALKGKVKCGCCGYAMVRRGKRADIYSCHMGNGCGSFMRIETKKLEEAVLVALRLYMEAGQEKEWRQKNDRMRKMQEISAAREEKRLLEMKVGYAKSSRIRLYQQWKEGEITKDEYTARRNELARQEAECKGKLELLDIRMVGKPVQQTKSAVEQGVCQVPQIQSLTKKLVDDLIERVDVYACDRIEIQWKFQEK